MGLTMIPRMAAACLSGLSGLLAVGCEDPPSAAPAEQVEGVEGKPKGAEASGEGYPPPSLDTLLSRAREQEEPAGGDVPYEPQQVTVRPRPMPAVDMLPKDDEGRPIFAEVPAGLRLVFDAVTRQDAITAMGTCLTIVTKCMRPATDGQSAISLDSCFHSAPSCQGNRPWDESDDCCPTRCQELYAALRRDDYSQEQGLMLTSRSMCFPGLAEKLQEGRPDE